MDLVSEAIAKEAKKPLSDNSVEYLKELNRRGDELRKILNKEIL